MKNIEAAVQAVTKHLQAHPDHLMHLDEELQDYEWSTEGGETNELTIYTHGDEHNFNGQYIVELADDLSIICITPVNDECGSCADEADEPLRDYEAMIRL